MTRLEHIRERLAETHPDENSYLSGKTVWHAGGCPYILDAACDCFRVDIEYLVDIVDELL